MNLFVHLPYKKSKNNFNHYFSVFFQLVRIRVILFMPPMMIRALSLEMEFPRTDSLLLKHSFLTKRKLIPEMGEKNISVAVPHCLANWYQTRLISTTIHTLLSNSKELLFLLYLRHLHNSCLNND